MHGTDDSSPAAQPKDAFASPSSPEAEVIQHLVSLESELMAYLIGRLRSEEEARDVVQGAFVRALRSVEDGCVPDNTRAWLYQIARNLSVDLGRREQRQFGLLNAVEDQPPPAQGDSEHPTVFEAVARALPRFIRELPEPYRSAVSSVELEGLSQGEAAERLGVSLSAMKTRVHRGRKMLRKALHDCCAFDVDGRRRVIACRYRGAPRAGDDSCLGGEGGSGSECCD